MQEPDRSRSNDGEDDHRGRIAVQRRRNGQRDPTHDRGERRVPERDEDEEPDVRREKSR